MKRSILLFGTMLLTVSMAFSQNVIQSWDFGTGIPAGWVNGGVDKTSTSHTNMWKYTTTGNNDPGGWPTIALQSPTAANGWVKFDSDSLDNGACPAPQRGYLTSTGVNCSGHNNVLLQFYDVYFSYDGNPRVVVNNGTTSDTINVHSDYDFTYGLTPNGGLQQFDISSVAANQSNVTITLLWDMTQQGYFWWQVDDISLIDAPGNDLQISQTGGSIFYKYPIDELDSISYYAFVTSVGANDQYNSRISFQVKQGSNVVFTDTSALGVTLPYGIDSPLIGINSYLPTAIGNYTTQITAFSDSVDGLPYNNTYSDVFAVTDSVMAAENGVYGGSFITYLPAADAVSGVAASQEWANIFYLPNADTVTSITASFDGALSAPNAVVQANVYSLPANFQGYGAAYACTPVIQTGPRLIKSAEMTIPNTGGAITVVPVTMPVINSTGAADAAILQPGFYAVSITNVNDSLISVVNSFTGAGVFGTPGGEIASGSLTAYSNTHFFIRMNFGHNFDLLQAAFTRTPGINPLKVYQPVTFTGNTNGTGDANTQYSWVITDLVTTNSTNYTGRIITDTFTVADSVEVCLTVTDGGNTATACSEILVRDLGVGINEVSPLSGLTMVPNPTTGRVTISAEAAEGVVSTTVIDLLGNVVKTFSDESNGNFTHSYDLSSLSSGLYIVKIENAGTVITKKLSISKQ